MHKLLSPKQSTKMLPIAERYKLANERLRAEMRRLKADHAKEVVEKDSMIQDLNEENRRLKQQLQQQLLHPTRSLSKCSSSSLSTTNKPTGALRRSNSHSASTNSTAASQLKMAELASFSSSFSNNSLDGDESISSHAMRGESFFTIPPEPPLTEETEEEEAEEEEPSQEEEEEDMLSHAKSQKSVQVNNRPDDDEEEVFSDQLPRRNHSLSTFVKSTSKRFVRRMSRKKSPRPFFRRQLRRKGTPVPVLADMTSDLKEEMELAGNEKEDTTQRDIHFNPDEDIQPAANQSPGRRPRLDSLLLQHNKPSIYSNDSSTWSMNPIPSDSPHRQRLQTKSSSVWSIEPLPSDSAAPASKPRRVTIASTTVRVRALPRELSLDRIVSDEEDSEDDDEDLPNPPSIKSDVNGLQSMTTHTVEVHCRHVVDACGRRGVYSGKLDLQTQLPHGQGSMSYPGGSKYSGSWHQGHWHGKAIYRHGKESIYNGYFVQDQKEGSGILQYSNGKIFEGRFKDDEIREGTMTDSRTGSTHEGLFENGRGHGFGSHQYSDGVQFQGQFEKGERHGHGTCLLPEGGFYTGDFQNDMAHGVGKCVNEDGTVEHSGQWDAGQPVLDDSQIYDA